MRVLLALLVLAGCSDPFRPVEEGALWLLDASDDVFFHANSEVKISSPKGLELDGRGFMVGEQMLRVIPRRIKKGEEGPLRESERLSVSAGREVTAGIHGVFDLRFTTHPRGEGQTVDDRFAWAGGSEVGGTLDPSERGAMGFLKPNGNNRYSLLLVSINQPE